MQRIYTILDTTLRGLSVLSAWLHGNWATLGISPQNRHLRTERNLTEGSSIWENLTFCWTSLKPTLLLSFLKKKKSCEFTFLWFPHLIVFTALSRVHYSPQESLHIHRSGLLGKQCLCSSQCLWKQEKRCITQGFFHPKPYPMSGNIYSKCALKTTSMWQLLCCESKCSVQLRTCWWKGLRLFLGMHGSCLSNLILEDIKHIKTLKFPSL